jgi:CubicO group peptidase (beta-lactamase class C family)
MPPRRAFLAGSMASLLPGTSRAQKQLRVADLLSRLLPRYHVPAASAALILGGEIVELVALGADRLTLFQAASISKVATAVLMLRLAEEERIGLDTPVNDMLRSWSLPGAGAGSVTPRLLLSHRAGTSVPGFPGYAAGVPLPSLAQILDGRPPANTAAVRVAWPPGEAFRYSGGGTMVLQRLAMDATGRTFDALARERVLAPAGMRRSGFFQPLAASETDAASAYDSDGRPLPGRCHVYPEHAAAGLWSTPGEIAQLALAIAASWRDGGLLTQASAALLATPVASGPTSAGMFVQLRAGKPPYLYHYGVNAGFRSVLVFAADASFGVVLMTNGDGARMLIAEFLARLFEAYDQDTFRPAD